MGTNLKPRRQITFTIPEPYYLTLEDAARELGVTVGTYLRTIAMSNAQNRMAEDTPELPPVRTDSREFITGWVRGWTANLEDASPETLETLAGIVEQVNELVPGKKRK